ncbi:MAG: ATP-binding cassette domain-containing protein [Deinococcota bacterium]|nr:ATP-binding cassette domain-containing protein [Deinococcota bacterium]
MLPSAAIEVEGVYKRFGKVLALQGVDLRVPAGKVFGLLGPNGAGKTTLVRVLTTLLTPDAGYARVLGLDVVREAERLRGMIGLAGQYAAVDENLTGRENLEMVGRLYHLSRQEAKQRAAEVLERFSLLDAANRPAKTYSGGMRRRLDLGASLVGHPRVLFLDEPTTGLDPRSRLEMWGLIRELVREGSTLLLTTQYLEEADELADRVAVIDQGRLIAEGTADELKARMASDVLEVVVADPAQLGEAARALRPLGADAPQLDEAAQRLTLPVSEGAQSLVAAVRALDDVGVKLADLSLRRPSLDDVFLALTGQTGTDAHAPEPAPSRRP